MKRTLPESWDLPAAVLLLLALLTSAERLVATGWTEGLGVTLALTLLGTGLGLALGVSCFRRPGIYLLSIGYNLTVVPWVLGTAQYPGVPWQERLASLGGRLGISFSLFFSGHPVKDPLLFIAFAAAVYWILSVHAGYALARKTNFIASILPAGILLFIVQLYDNWSGARIGLLAFYLFASLLLLGRLNYAAKRLVWKEQRLWYSSASITDLTIGLAITTLVIILLAWLTPAPAQPLLGIRSAWETITQPLKQARDDLANAVAGLQEGANSGATDFYGSSLPLGTSSAGGDSIIFSVRVPTMLGVSRYYWSVRTYDQYLDDEWSSTVASERSLQPNRQALILPDASRWPTAEFIFSIPSNYISTLVTPLRPVWVSRPSILTFIPVSEGVVDPLRISVEPPIRPGETYTVHAAVANPSQVQLITAGSNYPAWVTERYLQLPEDLPLEIAELARLVAAGAETPYDKADAITAYLRENIHYTRSITSPAPPDQDPMAWFLFTSREGYCNYYATAEVLMLRSLGIPARMAVGFSDGEIKPPDRRIVRQRNAHAWPEVYFPGIGWVEFEPTSGELPLARPRGEIETALGAGGASPDSTPQVDEEENAGGGGIALPVGEGDSGSGVQPGSMQRLILTILIIAVVVAGTGFMVFFGPGEKLRRKVYDIAHTPLPVHLMSALTVLALPIPLWLQRWVNWTRLNGVERSFRLVHRSLRWLGVKGDPARTPAQAAALLGELLPASTGEINVLLHEYQRTLFAVRPGDAHNARRAAEVLQGAALRAALQKHMHALRRFLPKGKPK
jgi:transglutaminase-like putative cysteine protease